MKKPPNLLTPKQVAQAIGVSESSLKRWCDRGLLSSVRTPGGHRRVALDAVIEFLRTSEHQMVRPELLGLPSNTGRGPIVLERAREAFREALLGDDASQCRRIVFDLYLAGESVTAICDGVLAEALHEIGALWSCGDVEVYQERRACNLCLRILTELRSMIPSAADDAPLAIGGAPECDPYMLPTAMVEASLRPRGWRARSLGSRLPFATLAAAIRDRKPNIFWLSVSHIDDEDQFIEAYQAFHEEVRSSVAVVVGGRALTESLRERIEYAAYCDKLKHLDAFADALKRSLTNGDGDASDATKTEV